MILVNDSANDKELKKAWDIINQKRQLLFQDLGRLLIAQLAKESRELAVKVRIGEINDPMNILDSNIVKNNEWNLLFERIYTIAARLFVSESLQELKSDRRFFDEVVLRRVLQYVGEVGAEKVKNITDNTKKQMQQVLQEGINQGLGAFELAKLIDERFLDINSVRAKRIARTETVAASNAGSYIGAQAVGELIKKVWLSAQDDRVRGVQPDSGASHIAMNGQKQDMNDSFVEPLTGDQMQFPGDSSQGASAKNIVNCRCTIIYERI